MAFTKGLMGGRATFQSTTVDSCVGFITLDQVRGDEATAEQHYHGRLH
jgi:hypothetical protein